MPERVEASVFGLTVDSDARRHLGGREAPLNDIGEVLDVQRALSAGEADVALEQAIIRTANTISRLRWLLGIAPRRRQTLTPEDPLAVGERLQGGA